MNALMLDGNAAGGVLYEIFGTDVTAAIGTCDSCGASGEVATVHLYRGAGLTLRCPHCEAVLMKIATAGPRIWVDFRGLRTLELQG